MPRPSGHGNSNFSFIFIVDFGFTRGGNFRLPINFRMKPLYLACVLFFCWSVKNVQQEGTLTASSIKSFRPELPAADRDTVAVEQRNIGQIKVLVQRTMGEENIYIIITTMNQAGVKIEQLAFAETLSAVDSVCHRYQEHGEYQFMKDLSIKIVTKSYHLACGIEQPDNESDEQYLNRLMNYDDPFGIPGRELNQENEKRYDINEEGKIVERKNGSSNKVVKNRWLALTRFDKLPKAKLRMLRNTIYARKGYTFKTEDLRSFFSKKDWYEPKYDNIAKFLSSSDKELISYLENLENR